LSVPSPPSRVFAPAEEAPLAAVPAVPEPQAAEAPELPPQRPARRVAAPTPEPEKVEAAPAAPVPVAEPPRELRAASTPADAEAERKVRTLLLLASRDLGQVDYRRLSPAGREQYDQAKSFSQQADEALAQRNYVFAQTLADRAAKIANELLGR
jgi:hypothetical protein